MQHQWLRGRTSGGERSHECVSRRAAHSARTHIMSCRKAGGVLEVLDETQDAEPEHDPLFCVVWVFVRPASDSDVAIADGLDLPDLGHTPGTRLD
eukprot:2766117-Rhodomonas_salina.2